MPSSRGIYSQISDASDDLELSETSKLRFGDLDAPARAARDDIENGRSPKFSRRRWNSTDIGLYKNGEIPKAEDGGGSSNFGRVEMVEGNADHRTRVRRLKRKYDVAKLCILVPLVSLATFGAISFLKGLYREAFPMSDYDRPDQFLPNWGRPGYVGDGLQSYATDYTRDVIPIPCHSHNDYWRRIPLYEAIHYGCTSVEADVWHFPDDDELYVGHSLVSLTPNRTFRSLYVNPLVDLLDHQNPSTPFADADLHGIFDEDPKQTLVLLVDFKTDGADLFLRVQSQLERLRSRNYLTYFNGTSVVPGPITIVGTGKTPFDTVIANTTYREIFFDAPLDEFWAPSTETSTPYPSPRKSQRQDTSGQRRTSLPSDINNKTALFTPETSYYASVSFKRAIGRVGLGRLSTSQLRKIRAHIRGAQAQGLKARFWETPDWPIGLRNYVWDVLVREGADYLNVDDLYAASKVDWGGGG